MIHHLSQPQNSMGGPHDSAGHRGGDSRSHKHRPARLSMTEPMLLTSVNVTPYTGTRTMHSCSEIASACLLWKLL